MEDLKLEHLNYETWLIWDDIISKLNVKEYIKVSERNMEDIVFYKVFENTAPGFSWTTKYARMMLSSVNYSELAVCFNEKIQENDR
jgi:hypothetical protein